MSGSSPASTGFSATHPVPGLEVQLALGRAARARVHRDHAGGDRRLHEERQPDRDLEARPQIVGDLEVREPQRPVAGRPVVALARAHRPARLARAHDPALGQGEQVAMVLGDVDAAQIAAPRSSAATSDGGGRASTSGVPGEPAQSRDDHRRAGARRPRRRSAGGRAARSFARAPPSRGPAPAAAAPARAGPDRRPSSVRRAAGRTSARSWGRRAPRRSAARRAAARRSSAQRSR